jgi:hypothetical protein
MHIVPATPSIGNSICDPDHTLISSPALMFGWSGNSNIVDKTHPDLLSHEGAWTWERGTPSDLAAHIGSGHPWMPARLDPGARRWQSKSNYAEVLSLDIDNGLSIAACLGIPFIQQHLTIGIESASSCIVTEKNPDGHEKYRLVFALAAPIVGHANIRLCAEYLAHIVGHADPAAKDASRFYFGARGKTAFHLTNNTLPPDFLEQAQAWGAERDRQLEIEIQRNAELWAKAREGLTLDDQLERVKGALEYIPPYSPGGGTYDRYVRICGAVLRELGSDGHALLMGSPLASGRHDGGFDRFLRSVERSRPTGRAATLGSLFHWAKECGYRFPERVRSFDRRPALRRSADRLVAMASGATLPTEPIKTVRDSGQDIDPGTNDRPVIVWEPGTLPRFEAGTVAPILRLQHATDQPLAIAEAIALGYTAILDARPTGNGKSHGIGQLKTPAYRQIHVMGAPRSPSTPTVESRTRVMPIRHPGLIQGGEQVTPLGAPLMREVRAGETPTIAPSCTMTAAFRAAAAAGITAPEGKTHPICLSCPFGGAQGGTCATVPGWFRHDAAAAIASGDDLRLHPATLRDPEPGAPALTPDDLPTRPDLLIHEESDALIVPRIRSGDRSQLAANFSDLELADRQTFEELYHLRAAIQTLIDTPTKWGHDAAMLRDALAVTAPDLDLGAWIERVNESVELTSTDWVGVVRGTAPAARLLPDLLAIIAGAPGDILINGERITITTPDDRYLSKIRVAAANVFLSATDSPATLSARTGIPIDSILVIEATTGAASNIQRFFVSDFGRAKSDRAASTDQRINALVPALAAHLGEQIEGLADGFVVADHLKKSDRTDAEIKFFSNSRGANDFEGLGLLVSIGLPKPNLGAVRAEYGCLNTPSFTFQQFYAAAVQAAMTQLEGRLRANRYPDRQFAIAYLSDDEANLPEGCEMLDAVAICPECADRTDRAALAIFRAVEHLMQGGTKITQTAIAGIVGVSKQAISKLLANVGVGLSAIIEAAKMTTHPYRDSIGVGCQNPQPPDPAPEPLPDRAIEAVKQQFLPLLVSANGNASKLWAIVSTAITELGADAVYQIYDMLPDSDRQTMLQALNGVEVA